MDQERDGDFEKAPSGRIAKVRCWMCKRSMVTGINERCAKCRLNNCLHCGTKLVRLRRLLENKEPLGDIISVCSNRECSASFDIMELRGIWKVLNDGEIKPEYVQ